MNNFLANVKLLTDILTKKEGFLEKILNITLNQRTIILSNVRSEDGSVFFSEMNREKQIFIEEIIKSDLVFQSIFEKLGDTFEEYAERNKEVIRFMQDIIRRVTDIDVRIRVEEERNKLILSKPCSLENSKLNTLSVNELLNKYKENYIKK